MRSWSSIYHILHIYRYFYLYCFCQAKQGAIVLQAGDGKFWTNPKDSDTRIRHSFAATARSIIPFPESCFSFFLSESDPCNNVKVTYPNKKKTWSDVCPSLASLGGFTRLSFTPFKPSTPISWYNHANLHCCIQQQTWYGMICSQGEVKMLLPQHLVEQICFHWFNWKHLSWIMKKQQKVQACYNTNYSSC